MNPIIIDTTLRDGEQAPGVSFSIDDKLKIAALLEKLGVDEVEAGTPAIGLEEQEAIRKIAASGFSFVTSSWCRANVGDIQQAAKLGTGSINISLPVSDIQIETLGKTRLWVLAELKKVIAFASSSFPHVTMGAQDASRADIAFLKEYIFHAIDAGAHRLRISDTVGIYDPTESSALMTELLREFPHVSFEFHAHNDLGLATANTIAALQAGANCASVTVNGLGERAGNASLEQILAILKNKYDIQHFQTKNINELSILVEKLSHRPISEDKPIVGKNVFTHESGIHTSALLKNKNSYQFLDPVEFGRGPLQIVFGKHSGRGALRDFFGSLGIDMDSPEINKIHQLVKTEVSKLNRNLNEGELLILYSMLIQEIKEGVQDKGEQGK